MGYFTYLAKQAFGESPTGERLFFPTGPLARPYLLPSEDIEQRLFHKQLWLSRLLVGGLILLQPVLFTALPILMESALALAIYIVAMTLATVVISHLVLRHDLAGLPRGESRLSYKTVMKNFSQRNSRRTLWLGLLGSLAFVAIGVGMIAADGFSGAGWVVIAFFGACGTAWGYAIDLHDNEP